MKPLGDLDFETALAAFGEAAGYGEAAGADLIHIETMSDMYEMKAAVLGAKEHTSLPVFVTMIFDEKGKAADRGGRGCRRLHAGGTPGGRPRHQLRPGPGADAPHPGGHHEVHLPCR